MLGSVREVIGMARRKRTDIAKAYAKLLWLKKNPAQQTGATELLGLKFYYGNFDLFLTLFREVFVADSYRIEHATERPLILDAGANIGLATLYFKYRYPNAEVHAFEPDEANFEYLRQNVEANHLKDVHLHKVALSDQPGELKLYTRRDVKGGDIGVSINKDFRANFHKADDIVEFRVPAELLSRYVDRPVDMFKLDVEGAEELILQDMDATDKLRQVKQITMEYHQVPNGNPLSAVLAKMERAGLRYEIGQWGTDVKNERIAHCLIRAFKLPS